MTAPTTHELIERLRQGGHDAFSPLFERYCRRLAVMIHYKLYPGKRRPDDVEEVLKETFSHGLRELNMFQNDVHCSFLNWLSRIADNVIIDCASKDAGSGAPVNILIEREDVKAFIQNLDSLSEQHRQVILLAKIEGLSTREMADHLGEPEESIALKLRQAMQYFRTLDDWD